MSHSTRVPVLDLADLEIETLVVGSVAPYQLETITAGHGLTEVGASFTFDPAACCCGCCCSCCA